MTVRIHDKEYVLVSERVQMCHADEGFSMVAQERYEMNGRHFVSVTIEVKGKRYIGDAEIKFGARPNTPDGTNPLECAQTSALGRALGFANYGVIDGIASADEVLQAEQEQRVPMGKPVPSAAPPADRVPVGETKQSVGVQAPEAPQEQPLGAQLAREEISKLFGPLMQAGIYDNSDEGKKLYLRHVAKWIRLKQAADLFNAVTPTQLEYVKACVAEELRKVAA